MRPLYLDVNTYCGDWARRVIVGYPYDYNSRCSVVAPGYRVDRTAFFSGPATYETKILEMRMVT